MATSADIEVLQAFVDNEMQNLALAVHACAGKLSGRAAQWPDLHQRCNAFVGAAPQFTFGLDDLYAQGLALQGELAWWRGTLTDLGCDIPTTDWHNRPRVNPPGATDPPYIPYVAPEAVKPGHTFLDQAGQALPFIVILLAVREWNDHR